MVTKAGCHNSFPNIEKDSHCSKQKSLLAKWEQEEAADAEVTLKMLKIKDVSNKMWDKDKTNTEVFIGILLEYLSEFSECVFSKTKWLSIPV